MLIKPKLEVELSGADSIHPGQRSSLKVRIGCPRPCPINGVRATLIGLESQAQDLGASNVVQATFLSIETALSGARTLSEGLNAFDLEVELPEGAPTTLSEVMRNVGYRLAVHVDVPFWPDTRQEFELVATRASASNESELDETYSAEEQRKHWERLAGQLGGRFAPDAMSIEANGGATKLEVRTLYSGDGLPWATELSARGRVNVPAEMRFKVLGHKGLSQGSALARVVHPAIWTHATVRLPPEVTELLLDACAGAGLSVEADGIVLQLPFVLEHTEGIHTRMGCLKRALGLLGADGGPYR